ncbi:HPP family [Kingella potus]|uniref:HPP family n=1 Tax=Kingella potus TaxID=265175 RepID=A0A377R256_9NEIS|nr:HPP family protein [Kingella potus]UOP00363.1 HPP family protein [Kingella potus]STR02576.1 HPP family [Kingella potus]
MNVKNPLFAATELCPPRLPWKNIALAWLGACLAAAAVAFAQDRLAVALILGSFGASCLLVFAYPQSPFAQPRNVVGGHFAASLTGLVFLAVFGAHWWSMALAVGTAVALMLVLRVPHPPAGSNPFIVMLAGASWDFLLMPTLLGSLILVAVALLYNNCGTGRRYPTYWW